jgi:hypothetical protein
MPVKLVSEHKSNRDKLRGSTSAGRGNLFYCVTGTLQVLTLYSEIHAQVH